MNGLKPLFDLSVCAKILDERSTDTLIITSNRRLATQVKTAIDERQLSAGRQSWYAPEVYPIEDWIMDRWQELILLGHPEALAFSPLSSTQEQILWEQLIRQDEDGNILKPRAAAKSAMAAYRTLALWQTPVSSAFQEHPDCQRFSQWLRDFKQVCRNKKHLDFVTIATHVTEAFAQKQLATYPQLLTLGFQQLPPLYATMLQSTGAKLIKASQKRDASELFTIPCENAEQELRVAASWIKQQLEEQPQQRIALVVPDLKQRRAQVERIFNATFEPQYLLPATARYQTPYNISAGIALSDTPLIHTALTLLKLHQQQIPSEDWLSLMRSPFLFDQQDIKPSLCQAEQIVRRTELPILSANQLAKILTKIKVQDDAIASWLFALECVATGPTPAAKMPLAHWVERWSDQLRVFQWPGNRRLDSIEYQQVKRWQNALNEFLLISPIAGDVHQEHALRLLTSFISAIEFQAESRASPVQILGLLEGGGLHFDTIWLMGVNDHNWPPSPSPNPFIPLSIQRAANMPHASADRELAFTEALFNDYLHSANTLVASFALHEQGQTLRPSHLIEDFPERSAQPWMTDHYPHPYYQVLYQSKNLESLPDTRASILLDSDQLQKGGTQILKNQATCPFKAFAMHRLDAQQLEQASFHVTPQMRGIMLHRALELLWKALKNSDGLLGATPAQLNRSMNNATTSAVLSQAQKRPDLFGPALVTLEIRRLQNLITQWLQVEQQRSPFSVIETESAAVINIAGTALRVRIDRIDRLPDGTLLLIDYKTGSCSIADWQGERIAEPQLPLYSVSLETGAWGGEVSALAFAQINADKQAFVGVAAEQDLAPGIYSLDKIRNWNMSIEWRSLQSEWRSSLTKLMVDFKVGDARVDPKSPSVCKFCHLSPLCRIKDPRSFERVDA